MAAVGAAVVLPLVLGAHAPPRAEAPAERDDDDDAKLFIISFLLLFVGGFVPMRVFC